MSNLAKIIAAASDAYPDGMVQLYHDEPTGQHGDSFAKAIEIELRETFDPADTFSGQVATAAHVIATVANEMRDVAEALAELDAELNPNRDS